ncbi:MAG: NAD(P)H-hydrate epimerase [Gemmataceae bacterium]
MRPLSREQIRRLDRDAVERFGIPSLVLMENAGRGAADTLVSLGIRGPVLICCGKGNNGGDGLVLARHLALRGFPFDVQLFADAKQFSPDAAAQWRIVECLDLPRRVWDLDRLDAAELRLQLARGEWLVDALYGTGLQGAVRPPLDQVISAMNAAPGQVVALDIPSGLDADTGEPLGATIRARHTVTFATPKLGFDNPAARAYTGKVHVADIGFPFLGRS